MMNWWRELKETMPYLGPWQFHGRRSLVRGGTWRPMMPSSLRRRWHTLSHSLPSGTCVFVQNKLLRLRYMLIWVPPKEASGHTLQSNSRTVSYCLDVLRKNRPRLFLSPISMSMSLLLCLFPGVKYIFLLPLIRFSWK